ncbi:unnamed protein product, partial [Staurois parvus]
VALVGTAGWHRWVHCWAQVGGTDGWHCWAPIIKALIITGNRHSSEGTSTQIIRALMISVP